MCTYELHCEAKKTNNVFSSYFKFLAEYIYSGERILKIGKYLAKLLTKSFVGLFWFTL